MAVWKADYIKSNLQYEWKHLIIHAAFIRCDTARVLIALMKDQVKCINWADWKGSLLTNVWLCRISTETVPVIYSKTYLWVSRATEGREMRSSGEQRLICGKTLVSGRDRGLVLCRHGHLHAVSDEISLNPSYIYFKVLWWKGNTRVGTPELKEDSPPQGRGLQNLLAGVKILVSMVTPAL